MGRKGNGVRVVSGIVTPPLQMEVVEHPLNKGAQEFSQRD
nr:MAG TPA: hypothetical protein [Caudoviricetes sp.]